MWFYRLTITSSTGSPLHLRQAHHYIFDKLNMTSSTAHHDIFGKLADISQKLIITLYKAKAQFNTIQTYLCLSINQTIMKKIIYLLALSLAVVACNNNPKPIAKNITKTTVNVNGTKDSVINNPQKNYGTATIPDVCTKTLLQNIQATIDFKKITSGLNAANTDYVINWVKAENPELKINGSKITNGIQVLVNTKSGGTVHKLGSYIYNNEDGQLYYINTKNQFDKLQIDSNALKQIRNGCYWGVASHK